MGSKAPSAPCSPPLSNSLPSPRAGSVVQQGRETTPTPTPTEPRARGSQDISKCLNSFSDDANSPFSTSSLARSHLFASSQQHHQLTNPAHELTAVTSRPTPATTMDSAWPTTSRRGLCRMISLFGQSTISLIYSPRHDPVPPCILVHPCTGAHHVAVHLCHRRPHECPRSGIMRVASR